MKKSSTAKTRNQQTPNARERKAVSQPGSQPWQSLFSKRLPHRIGQPLSSGGSCGDGSAIDQ